MNAPVLLLYGLAGISAGTLYFASLRWHAGLFAQAGRLSTLIAYMAARFVLLAGLLTAASLQGAMPLLATAGGVLLARVGVLRWVAAP